MESFLNSGGIYEGDKDRILILDLDVGCLRILIPNPDQTSVQLSYPCTLSFKNVRDYFISERKNKNTAA
jgi:hypothetical protein